MYYTNDYDYNECSGRGMCSIAPNISSYQEILLVLLRSIAFYIINSEKNGLKFDELKKDIINKIANLISTNEYTDVQLLNIITKYYNDYIFVKREYNKAFKVKKDLPQILKLTPDMVLSDVLAIGHRILAKKQLNPIQKCYYELLYVMLKSVSLSYVKLNDYGIDDIEAQNQVINCLNIYNYKNFSVKKFKNAIAELALIDKKLWQQRQKAQQEAFGKSTKTSVSLSTNPGKAILVSGSNLTDLYNLLKTNSEISVYSHGELLIAHSFEKFKEFKNFKGHFATYDENYVLDYATFPGAVLITKHSTQNTEFLIRGRLFTTEDIPPKGVIKIHDNNFKPVIEAAEQAKGFTKGRKKENITISYNLSELAEIVDNINLDTEPFIFIIGMAEYSHRQAEYFDALIKNVPKNSHIISFSYPCKNNINIAKNFPLLLNALDTIFEKIPISYKNLVFFITKCDANSISGMINLKLSGAKNIYLSDCKPNIINPTVINTFTEQYGINKITTPKKDLQKIEPA